MKNLKKIMAVLMMVALLFTMGMTAFASEDGIPAGVIRITNAENGNEYAAYKVFDATYKNQTDGTKTISYTCSNEALIALMDADKNIGAKEIADMIKSKEQGGEGKTVTEIAGTICPFTYYYPDGDESVAYITYKTDFPEEVARGWVANHMDVLGNPVKTAAASGSKVELNVPYGYYAVKRTDAEDKTAITVDTAAPIVEVVDKNPNRPGDPSKSVEEPAFQVGDTVPFTMSVRATEYDSNLNTADVIKQYVFTDTPKGLTPSYNASDYTVQLYTTKTTSENGVDSYSGLVMDPADEEGKTPLTVPFTVSKATSSDNVIITVPWANETQETKTYTDSKGVEHTEKVWVPKGYPSPVYIVISTTMTLNANCLYETIENPAKDGDYIDAPVFKGVNTIKVTYDVQHTNGSPDTITNIPPVEVDVFTLGVSIRKSEEKQGGTALAGAKFILYKDVAVPTPTVDPSASPEATTDPTTDPSASPAPTPTQRLYYHWNEDLGIVEWVTNKDDADIVEADNNTSTAEFPGIEEGTYYLHEEVVPAGFNPPASDAIVQFTAARTGKTTVEITTDLTDNGTGIYTKEIVNNKGNVMPHTGGVGTTIFYVVGSILLVGAAVLLITKKRMGSNG